MRQFAGWVCLVLMASVGVAHAGAKHQQWKAVKRLGVGVAVEVRSAGQAGVEECRVVRVDDTALTCDRDRDPYADWGGGRGARLVIPRSAVEGVWVWQDAIDRRILLGLGFGFAIGAVLCSEGGPGPAFICAGVGALIGACVAIGGPMGGPWWYPPGFPRPMRQRDMERKLLYRAPADPAAVP